MSDYVDVAERIAEFRAKHPDGSLQSRVLRWPDADFPFVAVEANAYRTPDDPRPGVGLAWENFPGRTPYTKDSELQNAETSAWGRAIVAVLAADTKRGIASRQEVSRSSAPRGEGTPARTGARREARGEGRERVGADNQSSEGTAGQGPLGNSEDAAPEGLAGTAGMASSLGGPAPSDAHVHEWQPSPRKAMAEKGWKICACGKTRSPEEAA
jgi:hypothetical protein